MKLHIRICWINLYIPYVWSVFRIRKQIRIQHFRLNIDPDPIRIQGFDEQKLEKIYSWKRNLIFFWSKITTYASIQDVQTAEEAFIPQKRTSSSSKHEISKFFIFFGPFFALLDPDPDSESDPEKDPLTWMNPDSVRIRNIRNIFGILTHTVKWHKVTLKHII